MTEDRPTTVLYVEDDPDFQDAVQFMLEARGYRVRVAPSAEEGLTAFVDDPPDLALVDLMLEEVDSGLSLATQLRARDAGLPIFLLTSVGDALMDTHDWGRLGVTGVLQKPVTAETLVPILENALRARA
jgi:DNA-binding response OmpR family regulator